MGVLKYPIDISVMCLTSSTFMHVNFSYSSHHLKAGTWLGVHYPRPKKWAVILALYFNVRRARLYVYTCPACTHPPESARPQGVLYPLPPAPLGLESTP